MEKNIMNENNEIIENTEIPQATSTSDVESTSVESVDLFEAAEAQEALEKSEELAKKAYVPLFTDASENYHLQNDKKIREQLGISNEIVAERVDDNPDAISLESTAEFDEDTVGAPAKLPENKAEEDSDESISVYKFTAEDDEDNEAARQELDRINMLLHGTTEPEPAQPRAEQIVEAEEAEEEEYLDQPEEYVMPDPDHSDFGVYEPEIRNTDTIDDNEDRPSGIVDSSEIVRNDKGFIKDSEFTNPTQRESIKDKFLDSLLSIKIRLTASYIFGLLLLILEILSAAKAIPFNLFGGAGRVHTLGLVDFLLATGIFILALPETVRAFKYLIKGQPLTDLIPAISYLILGGYTLAVSLTFVRTYALFGFLFAVVCIPMINASLYRIKADFVAFKMISKNGQKQVIDKRNTRELSAENMALDGVVDEYKSSSIRTFSAEFISDFFKNSSKETASPVDFAVTVGIPFGLALIAGVIAIFLSTGVAIVNALAVFAIVFMLGCPAFSMLQGRISFFHSQRAALHYESTAVGEAAYQEISGADVITFNDTDVFGPDDVNLKRFMLYSDMGSMEKVMGQMSALFAAVGGPLDFMFSNAIDNRVRYKTATGLIIEDDGICGTVMGHKVYAGSEEYMRRNNIAIPDGAGVTDSRFDTTKVMYSAEDGEINAKFYIRYSFSEEFTMILPELREQGITPLVYTRDPNISDELLRNLSAGAGFMRVCRVYTPAKAGRVYGRVSAGMITYGDKIDAASTVLLAKKLSNFSLGAHFAELCSMVIGIILGILLSVVGMQGAATLVAAVWQIVWFMLVRTISYRVFLKENRKDED